MWPLSLKTIIIFLFTLCLPGVPELSWLPCVLKWLWLILWLLFLFLFWHLWHSDIPGVNELPALFTCALNLQYFVLASCVWFVVATPSLPPVPQLCELLLLPCFWWRFGCCCSSSPSSAMKFVWGLQRCCRRDCDGCHPLAHLMSLDVCRLSFVFWWMNLSVLTELSADWPSHHKWLTVQKFRFLTQLN